MSGSHSTDEAKQFQTQLNELFTAGHLSLRKWASIDETAFEGIPSEFRTIKSSLNLDEKDAIKTLGMSWTPTSDCLHFTIDISNLSNSKKSTKRNFLSDASKLYDPCGLLSPITIKVKMMMQDVWKTGVDWDDRVPSSIQTDWEIYRNELPLIENIRIPRWLKADILSNFLRGG